MNCELFSQEIACGVFRISDALHGPSENGYSDAPGTATQNSYLIIGQEKAALIDLAVDTPMLYSFAEGKAGKPLMLLLTHGHYDHVYHLSSAPEAWIHPSDIPLITEGIPGVYGPQEKIPFHPLFDGQCIDLGGRSVEIIQLPGHTMGSVLFLDHLTGTLLTGDTCARRLLYGLTPTIPLSEHCALIGALKRRPFSVMYSSHDRCALPKTYLDMVLYCILEALPSATETVDIPGFGAMRSLHLGKEDTLDYFDMAVVEKYINMNMRDHG